MPKQMSNFLDSQGLLVQQCGSTENYPEGYFNPIDSMFLTCNTIVFKEFLNDYDWYGNKPLSSQKTDAWVAYRVQGNLGLNKRYWRKNDTIEGRYWTNPDTLSRDNHIGYIMAMGKEDARNVAKEIIKRWSFFQNEITNKGEDKPLADFCGPYCWAIILRKCEFKWASLFDVFYFLHIVFAIVKSRYNPDVASTVYHELSGIVITNTKYPNFLTRLAAKLYIKFRAPVPGYRGETGIESALRYYSRADYDPPIYRIAKEVVNKLRRM